MRHTRNFLLVMMILVPVVAIHAQTQGTASGKVVDKMVATVNGDLITYSDLVWQLALQPDTPLDNPRSEDLNRALETVINQRLIEQEAEKLPTINPTDQEINTALAELIKRFPSPSEFQQRAQRVGLTAELLREIVRRRVETEKYLEFRFRSFTIVTPQEVSSYYRDIFIPRFRKRSPGQVVPTFEEVRAQIEKTLTESKVESDMTSFIDEARGRAEIIILEKM